MLPTKNWAAKHSELCYISHATVFIVAYKMVTFHHLNHKTTNYPIKISLSKKLKFNDCNRTCAIILLRLATLKTYSREVEV
jgi:hypothetical protein